MKKILAIGNSFSEDATTYLYDIAKADNIEIKMVNLFIGGCSLEKHCQNIKTDEKVYRYDFNGVPTERYVTLKEALLEENWDIITMQQASHESGVESSYFPYTTELYNYIKEYCPQSQVLMHQTWAYEIDSKHGAFPRYDCDQTKMYNALKLAYGKASSSINCKQIHCGDLIQKLREEKPFDYKNGGMSLCRDGFHINIPYGRYALALLWYKTIFKKDVSKNTFLPPNIENENLIEIIRKAVGDLT